jgi:site-specific DNA recombinase
MDVVRVFVDAGESAKTADRTQLLAMLAFCASARPRINTVVVQSLSRFARSVLDEHQVKNLLLARGTTLRSVTKPIDGTSTLDRAFVAVLETLHSIRDACRAFFDN